MRKIEGLENLRKLRILDLGANRIRVMEGLAGLEHLKSLWLGKILEIRIYLFIYLLLYLLTSLLYLVLYLLLNLFTFLLI